MHWRRKWQPTPVFLPGESQGRGILVGCCLWGRTESDMTEVTQQQQQQGQRSLAGYSLWGCKGVRHSLVTKQRQILKLHKFSRQMGEDLSCAQSVL